jgi:hypothetical protein
MLWTYSSFSSTSPVVRWFGWRSLLVAVVLLMSWSAAMPTQAAGTSCKSDAAAITLPNGFCATIFADNIGHARQMAVTPDGTLYVNTWSGIYYNKTSVLPLNPLMLAATSRFPCWAYMLARSLRVS